MRLSISSAWKKQRCMNSSSLISGSPFSLSVRRKSGQHLFIEVDLLGSVIVSNDGGQQLALALAIKFGDAKHGIEDIGLILGFTKL